MYSFSLAALETGRESETPSVTALGVSSFWRVSYLSKAMHVNSSLLIRLSPKTKIAYFPIT